MSPIPLCALARAVSLCGRFLSRYGLVLLLLAAAVPAAVAQTTYYIASNGSDAADGRSAQAPWQSLSKINTQSLRAGDVLLFRRGDTFRGTLTIRQSGTAGNPIRVDAYGTGASPIITGSVPLTNWTRTGNNIWQADCSACGSRVTGVYRNNAALPFGRYPNGSEANKGYLTVQAHNGKTQLTSQQPLTTNWTGAEAVVRPVQWILDRATITAQNGNTLTLNNPSGYELTDGWGYFIQNHPATLDQPGEWYYNPATKTIQLYADTIDPNQQVLTATVSERGIDLTGVSNIIIRSVQVTQTLAESIRLTDVYSLTLTDSYVTNAGEDGVVVAGSGSDVVLANNRITDINNNGVLVGWYGGVVFRNNQVRRIGLVPGRSKSGDGHAIGFMASGDGNVLVEGNRLDSIGYNGIVFSNNAIIQRNVISNFCLAKSDGGAIYTWNGNKRAMTASQITANIVYNGIGASEGAPNDAYSGANGIYMDDCAQNISLSQNSVFDCRGLGIYLHATNNITVTANTSFNNRERQFKISHNNNVCPARNNVVQRNVFVSKMPAQLIADYETTVNDLGSYGQFDDNRYARPFDDLFKIRAVYHDGKNLVGNDLSLSQWQTKFQKDPNSRNSILTYKGYAVDNLSTTFRLNNTFGGGTEGWSTWGPYGNGQVTWNNAARLDGGSLQVDFPAPSGHSDSFVIVTNGIGAITKGKTYLLRFDAVASSPDKKLQVYLRQQNNPWSDMSSRTTLLTGTTRSSYEMVFTAQADEAGAILLFQVDEDGKTLWLDNIRLQDAAVTPLNPNDYVKLAWNATARDSTVRLDGSYRDLDNQLYAGRIQLAPYSSVALMKDLSAPALSPATADLTLRLVSDRRCLKVGDVASFSVCLRGTGTDTPDVTWSCRLPDNLQIVNSDVLNYANGVLTGTVRQVPMQTDVIIRFQARPLVAGLYKVAAQVTTSSVPDPDSTPDSGTDDGEDDTAQTDLRVGDAGTMVFASPNPIQRTLPIVVSAQPVPDPTRTDLSLRMEFSQCTAARNELVTCTLVIQNDGGVAATGVVLQNQLPTGLQFSSGAGWVANGSALTYMVGALPVGGSVRIAFQARISGAGLFVNKAQVWAATIPDADSIPANGFANGEDDQAQASIRSR